MPIYMEYAGIKGNVTDESYKDHIAVHSFQFGVGRGIASPDGSSKDREASTPSVSEIVITKSFDISSVKLFEESLMGKGKKATIKWALTAPGEGATETFLEYTLENCLVSGYSVSSGGDNPSESISLNFTKIEMKYTPSAADNVSEAPQPFGWNLGTQRKV